MANITIWKRTVGGKTFYYHMACVTARMRSDEIGCHAWASSMVTEGVNCQYCGRDIHKNPRKVQSKVQKQYRNPLEVGDTVTVDLYGVKSGKVVATHDPGDGYGMSVEVELSQAWRGAKKLWFSAEKIERVENVDMAELPF